MNKKVFTVLSAAAVASVFYACGSGEIFEATQEDILVRESLGDDPSNAALNMCGEACASILSSSSEAALPVVSSSAVASSASKVVSSSSGPILINSSSSSQIVITSATSSSVSGSTTNLGTCAATTATINKASLTTPNSTTFTFTPDVSGSGISVMKFATATYTWDFGSDATVTGTSGKTSGSVSFSNSGLHTVGVHVSVDGKEGDATCTVQVNGDPITCSCEPDVLSTDFQASPNVTWTADCSTAASSMPMAYTWNGSEGTTTFTNTFTAAAAAYAPTLSVSNADNTVQNVTCTPVKVTDGPEYTIADNSSKVTFTAAGTYSVVIGFACQNKTFYCNGTGAPVGGSVNGVEMASSWYTTASLTAADCTGSASVTVIVDGPATCGAQ